VLGKTSGIIVSESGVVIWVGLNYFPKTSFWFCDVSERRILFLAGVFYLSSSTDKVESYCQVGVY
jgi:hypothetical protein